MRAGSRGTDWGAAQVNGSQLGPILPPPRGYLATSRNMLGCHLEGNSAHITGLGGPRNLGTQAPPAMAFPGKNTGVGCCFLSGIFQASD